MPYTTANAGRNAHAHRIEILHEDNGASGLVRAAGRARAAGDRGARATLPFSKGIEQ
jgi:hypothetical protein